MLSSSVSKVPRHRITSTSTSHINILHALIRSEYPAQATTFGYRRPGLRLEELPCHRRTIPSNSPILVTPTNTLVFLIRRLSFHCCRFVLRKKTGCIFVSRLSISFSNTVQCYILLSLPPHFSTVHHPHIYSPPFILFITFAFIQRTLPAFPLFD